ncbi:MAG TPA: DUF4340 domain-containing protein [Chloroflexota bacterium]|nr:DUF4340 domain-containing protein [Chloroflexota bacterium]
MSYRLTAVLLAILVILGGVVFYVTKQPSSSASGANSSTPQIVSFSSTDASKLVITGGNTTMEVDKSGADWKIAQPIQGAADTNRVQGWLDQLSTLTADRVITDTSDLGQFGLATPGFTTSVTLSSGKQISLSFGNKTPDQGDYYVRVAGTGPIYLVSATLGDDLKSALTQPPKALPTPTVAPTLPPQALPPTPAGTPTPTVTG